MRRITAFLAIALLSLAVASPAFGQSATENAYGGTAGTQEFTGSGGDTNGSAPVLAADTSATTDTSGSLPFTGLDLGIILLVGITLVGTGLIVRRAAGSNAQH
jgi:hypothetical protein